MKRAKNIRCDADGTVFPGQSLDRAVALAQSNNAVLTVMDVVPKYDIASAAEQRPGFNLDTLQDLRRGALGFAHLD